MNTFFLADADHFALIGKMMLGFFDEGLARDHCPLYGFLEGLTADVVKLFIAHSRLSEPLQDINSGRVLTCCFGTILPGLQAHQASL